MEETLEGMIAENGGGVGAVKKARSHFEAAIRSSPGDQSKQLRLDWFNLVQKYQKGNQEFLPVLGTFVGVYQNPFKEKRELFIKEGGLICKEFDKEIKLVRISETEFLPEKNQNFKISIKGAQVSIEFLHSAPKYLFEQSLPESHQQASFIAALSQLPDQPVQDVQAREAENLESARERTQRFRNALAVDLADRTQPAEALDENTEKENLPSFFTQ